MKDYLKKTESEQTQNSENNDYQDGRRSRMSEELPIHRNSNLTIFICAVMDMLKNGQSGRSITIQNQMSGIRKIAENECADEDMELLKVKLFEGEEGEFMNDRIA